MSEVLQLIARRYRKSRAGKNADATRDLTFNFHDLLKEADCLSGPTRHEAFQEVEILEGRGVLLVKRHRTGPSVILEVRLPVASGPALFEFLGEIAPHQEREALAEIFEQALTLRVPDPDREGWNEFCQGLAGAARNGKSVQPFDRAKPQQTESILQHFPQILAWQGESLLRFASTVIFGHSKILESFRSQIETCLPRITASRVNSLGDLGILENERSFLVHGPLKLQLRKGEVDLAPLEFPVRIALSDVRQAALATSASRCLTVENAAMLKELAKLESGILLASSGSEGGYANSAVVDFLKGLPPGVELWHFGDSDPKGFDILRDLRARTGKSIQSLHMRFRPSDSKVVISTDDTATIERLLGSEYITESEKQQLRLLKESGSKGDFEQETLGRPRPLWPFF